MTRLTHILLAGTMMPALLLAPIGGAFAQMPEQERHGPGAPGGNHAEPHGPAGEPHGPAGGAPHAAMEHATRPAEAIPHGPAAGAPHAAMEHATRPAEAIPHGPAASERVAPSKREPQAPRAETPTRVTPAAPQRVQAAPQHMVPNNHVDRMSPGHTPEAPARAAAPQAPVHSAEPDRAPEARPVPPAAQANPQRIPGQVAQPGQSNRQPGAAGIGTPANGARPGGPGGPGAPQGQPGQNYNNQQHGGISPGGAAAIGAAAGFAGGFLAATGAQSLGQIRGDRRESVEDGRTYIREPGRTIVEDGDQSYIVHDENDRFRQLGYNVQRERSGDNFVDIVNRPDGTRIITYTTPDGRMLRRVRRGPDGREFVLIDNSYDGRVRSYRDDVVELPPPPIGIPQDRYDVDYGDADGGLIYDTFSAPPLRAPPRRYTLDQIRYSPDIRRYVRSVDINTINFGSGSWIVPGAATGRLQALADGIKRTIGKNPNSVFLVEGFTDATGNPTDNLSLSDRRAQSVAAILTKDFNVPPENLTTQGYGQQNLKENTQGPSVINRRVVVQNITPLLAAGGQPPR